MKKQKLKLDELKVTSFVTGMENVKGGDINTKECTLHGCGSNAAVCNISQIIPGVCITLALGCK